MGERFINIEFPFQDDRKGKYLALNDVSEKAVKSDLMHLLLTNKDERLYLPNFGANLRKYLFEQNDEEVRTGIKQEIGQLRNEHHTLVKIDYTVTQGTFRRSDSVQIEL